MTYQFPTDVARQVEAFLAAGGFANEDDVLREALDALAQRNALLAELQAAHDAIEAGQGASVEDVALELREKYEFLR